MNRKFIMVLILVFAIAFAFGAQAEPTDPIGMVKLRPGAEGRARIDYLFRGANLALPTMPLDQDTTVTVQAVNSIGECWSAQYSAPARTNTADRFVGRSD